MFYDFVVMHLIKALPTGENQRVVFYLYKDNVPGPYFKLRLFVDVK